MEECSTSIMLFRNYYIIRSTASLNILLFIMGLVVHVFTLTITFISIVGPILGQYQIENIEYPCIQYHNYLRSLHPGTPKFRRPSNRLQGYAKQRAYELASTDNFNHPSQSKYGENLYYSWGKEATCWDALISWYNEIRDYDYNNPTYSHFTQVVWKGSNEVACYRSKSPRSARSYIVVSIYACYEKV